MNKPLKNDESSQKLNNLTEEDDKNKFLINPNEEKHYINSDTSINLNEISDSSLAEVLELLSDSEISKKSELDDDFINHIIKK